MIISFWYNNMLLHPVCFVKLTNHFTHMGLFKSMYKLLDYQKGKQKKYIYINVYIHGCVGTDNSMVDDSSEGTLVSSQTMQVEGQTLE